MEKSENTIILPSNPYIWVDLRNFPPLSYLGFDYVGRFESALAKIEDGLIELDNIRVEIANRHGKPIGVEFEKEIMEQIGIFESPGKPISSDDKFWGKYMSKPLIVSSCGLSNIIPVWLDISNKWETFNFYSYLQKRFEVAAEWYRGILEEAGYSIDDINTILKENRLSTDEEINEFAFEIFKSFWIKKLTIIKNQEEEIIKEIKDHIEITINDLEAGKKLLKKNYELAIHRFSGDILSKEDEEYLFNIYKGIDLSNEKKILTILNDFLQGEIAKKKSLDQHLEALNTKRPYEIKEKFKKYPAPTLEKLEKEYPELLTWRKEIPDRILAAIRNGPNFKK